MSVSFCHIGGATMASYRYRALIPAREIGASLNNPDADVLVFAKPHKQDVPYAIRAKHEGRKVIVDLCDPHLNLEHYQHLMSLADAVTCPTKWFADFLKEDYDIDATAIGDPYEFDETPPHCAGVNLLWFGHGSNFDSLQRVLPAIQELPLKIVSNIEGFTPWSLENLHREMGEADIVVMPETAPYKSANRTVEAIRRGCFVVAEPHPAINDFPGIWLGNIRKGIEWAQQNQQLANERTLEAQSFVRQWHSPKTLGSAWRTLTQRVASFSISEPEGSSGPAGCPLISTLGMQT